MEKTKFTNLINDLSGIAERDHWTTSYDKKLDYFYWTKKHLSKDAKLVKVSHETYFYFGHNKKIEGVFVEYLKNNFVEHNHAYKGFIKQFKKKLDNNLYTISNNKDAAKYLFALGTALRADIYQDDNEKGGKINFDELINFALAN